MWGQATLLFLWAKDLGSIEDQARVYDAIQHVLTTAKASGIRAGLHCMDPDYIKKMYECGFDFASLSNDVRLLTQVVTSQINAVRS